MPDYQSLYTKLFNAVTEAVEALEQQNFGQAREILVRAQQQTEEAYINT